MHKVGNNIAVVNFSSRSNGNCFKFSQYIISILNEQNEQGDIFFIDFSKINANSCGRCNYECFDDVCINKNDDIYAAYRKIIKCGQVISVVPIYCGLPCSNFFLFNERVQGALDDKEFDLYDKIKNRYIIIGNDGYKTAKIIFKHNDKMADEKDFLSVRSNDVKEKSVKGNLADYQYYRDMVKSFIMD
ncbi:MAG: NAD(P)H-dependent oxidoreductase [Bacteroides sp.]|nr:NAD(P)H-dependent oxidoreductase [Bacteroides sp.]